ncbi:two-component system response regulator [candidate division KSB3 bacterium]|uniref:Two-component system response regulator n=1 Tax=candidate division KSB3 bacterium TaxID=2044937 RepID=A0A2G6E6V9_9BACT|nr:MAG: two-component system response regulator [candidate division KSB3 bacterium]PIE30245.1 MAG: two-component system response regulator [candidate division KSB3 bacterium]
MEKEEHVILIVDDEEGLREGLSRLLEDEGYAVECAENAEKALEIVRKTHIDLMLTDMRMPGMSGIELLKQVRKIQEKIGVIILTGYGEIESYIEAMNFGAIEYVSKPFKENELKFIVGKILNQSTTFANRSES